MLDSGKFRRYLLYGIGEVVLVVVGILIALQVNNWNEEKIESSREQDFLLALQSDFHQTKVDFEQNKWEHQLVKSCMEQILDWAETGAVPKDQQEKFDSLLSNLFWRSSFDPPLGTVETILGSGNVDLIKNKEVVALLTRWTSLLKNYRSEELRAVDHFYETIYPFLSKHMNLQDMDKSIPTTLRWPHGTTEAYQLISNQIFHNMIYVHWVIQWNITDFHTQKIDESVKRILDLIDEDLDD